jgi:phosphohistidine phosphatase SixA
MRVLLARYRRASETLERLIDTLERAEEVQEEPPARPRIARIETDTGDIEAILAFQERLAAIDGVTKVTIAGSTPDRASFLVELESENDAAQAQIECSVCGKIIQPGTLPASHGLCESCREEFGGQPRAR